MRSTLLRLLAILFAFALIAAACGDDDDDGGVAANDDSGESDDAGESDDGGEEPATDDDGGEEPATDDDGGEEPATDDGGGEEPAAEAAMTVTVDLADEAVWSDGTAITAADINCTWQAFLNTPGSVATTGYDQIISIEAGASDKQAVITFSTQFAPYKTLFNMIIPDHATDNCSDISALTDAAAIPLSGRAYQLDSWGADQAILTANPNYWGDAPATERVVIVPREEVTALTSGEVDMIFPQAFAGIADALEDDNVEFVPGYGTNYEAIWFQQLEGPLADPILRQALSMSFDRNKVLDNIYGPIFPGSDLLQCGLWVPTVGPWCDNTQFNDSYDPDGAVTLLEENGWALEGGLWTKDGEAPEIRWMVNTPNPRREDTQALMIPDLQEKGFNVVADNGDAATVFQQRLPGLDYDIAMYISVATPDPGVTFLVDCDQIPTEANEFQGQNTFGWCNEDVSALALESDVTLDEAARVELIHQIGQGLVDDHVGLPLFQFPNIAAWRTDVLGDETPGLNAANYRGFGHNLADWESGDGEIIIGAEQWPDCINPVTECAFSSWMVWSTTFLTLPAIWDTTADGGFELTNMVSAEPAVDVL